MSDQVYIEEAIGMDFAHLSDLVVAHVLAKGKLEECAPNMFRWHIGETLIATAYKGRNKNDCPDFVNIQFTKTGKLLLLTELDYRLHNIRKRIEIESL